MTALVHYRKMHRQSGAPYPACMHSAETLAGVTSDQAQSVTCAVCKMLARRRG